MSSHTAAQHGAGSSSTERTEAGHKLIDITTSGCLFDLDGTLVESTDCVVEFWRDFGRQNGIDGDEILKTSHGRRTTDILEQWKPELATTENAAKWEARIPANYKHLAKQIPGVHDFLASLPASQWGIVTSGTYPLASGWLQDFLGIELPKVFITAERIKEGKPNPEGYLKGHKELGLLERFLVFEDAPAGIKAGKDAGATVIGMATTYDAERVKASGADIVIPDLTHVGLKSWNPDTRELVLTIRDPVA